MTSLALANIIRTARADLKRDLKSGRESVIDYLIDPPAYMETMKVFDLLLAMPRTGNQRANRICVKARISPSKTIGGLSERQREELVYLIQK